MQKKNKSTGKLDKASKSLDTKKTLSVIGIQRMLENNIISESLV